MWDPSSLLSCCWLMSSSRPVGGGFNKWILASSNIRSLYYRYDLEYCLRFPDWIDLNEIGIMHGAENIMISRHIYKINIFMIIIFICAIATCSLTSLLAGRLLTGHARVLWYVSGPCIHQVGVPMRVILLICESNCLTVFWSFDHVMSGSVPLLGHFRLWPSITPPISFLSGSMSSSLTLPSSS